MDLETLAYEARDIVYGYLEKREGADNKHKAEKWLKNYIDTGFGSLPVFGRSFEIGGTNIANPVVSAPLAGISDNTYRIFAKFFGCGLTFSEMVTGCGLYYNHKKSMALAAVTELERPCAVQIFGSEPEIMAEAAARVEAVADIIDINMGCPVPKILKSGSGGCLLKDIKKAGRIVEAVAKEVEVPVTVKVRLGWDSGSINVLDMAKTAEEQGAGAITIHGRTVKQGFSGTADYSHIRMVKDKVGIAVIASGDIGSPTKAQEVLKYTGCDAIMVGRNSKGSMWVLMDILLGLLGSSTGFMPDLEWRKEFAACYLKFLIFFKGEEKAVREFRKYLSWIFKGVRGISRAKKTFFTIKSFNDAIEVMDRLKRDVAQPG
ncbi:MAG: tRNA dihydrouridine synthase DusB [Actinomycetota bacterium]